MTSHLAYLLKMYLHAIWKLTNFFFFLRLYYTNHNYFFSSETANNSMESQKATPSRRNWSRAIRWNKLTHLDYNVLRRGSSWQAINWHVIKTIQGRTHSDWKTFSWALSHCSEQWGKKGCHLNISMKMISTNPVISAHSRGLELRDL